MRFAAKASNSASTAALIARRFSLLALGLKAVRDLVVEGDALFASAAVDIAQNIDRRRHRVVDADAASNRHARYRDRRRLRSVVDGGDESGFKKFCLTGSRQFAARQQPDHFGEANSPN